ncbi:hypothetical protein BGZ54_003897, partial [Gamsiella multidivaricata]
MHKPLDYSIQASLDENSLLDDDKLDSDGSLKPFEGFMILTFDASFRDQKIMRVQ